MSDAPLSSVKGSCHCGAVRYTADVDLSQPVMACNCSICSRAGYLLTFVPAARFHLESGEDALTDYRFARAAISHPFCSTCGIRSFCSGEDASGAMYGINARCLEDIDPEVLTVHRVDGKSL